MTKLACRSLAATLALALSAPAFAGQVHTAGLTDTGRFDRFIVRFVDGSPEAKNAGARQGAFDAAGRAEGLALAHQLRLSVGADVVRSNHKLDRARAERLMQRLANNPDVAYVEVDKLNKPIGTPNDTSYSQQWGFFNATGGIRADQAWDLGNGAGVVVAVIDTGITAHSDLDANIVAGYDFIQDATTANDGNGRDADPHDPGDWEPAGACDTGSAAANSTWHGTHVAGTVAALTNNGKGVAGTAGGAKVMPLRVLGRCGGYTSDIVDAITWASGGSVPGVPANPNPAEVINLSLGGSGACSSTEQAAINGAVSRGTVVVVAAGNEDSDVSTNSPGNCANVVAVAATTSSGTRASFSNYGAGVDVSAPGYGIVSTVNKGTTVPGVEGYASYSGTSMATPHVAGVVALMQSYAGTPLSPAQVEAVLKSTARAFPVAPAQAIGAGIVDARAAMVAAAGGTAPPPPPPTGNVAPVANFIVATSGLTASFTDKSTDSDGHIVANSWSFGDGISTTTSVANPVHTYAAAGTYTVTEWVSDNGGKLVSTTKLVSIGVANVAPVANFSVATSGLTASFTDKSTDSDGRIVANSWSFGDGISTTTSVANPVHTYAKAGTYTVTEWVSDNGGTLVSTTRSVSVGAANVAPVVNFSVATSGLTASFTDLSTDSDGVVVAHSWSFGDGVSTTTSVANPVHTYAAAGTYTVTEWISDNGGTLVSTTRSVTVSSGGSGGTVLANGVAVLVPATATGAWSPTYTLVVPAGRPTLTFSMTGGSGDADMYVKFGSAPTSTVYDCSPLRTGNTETCTFNAPAPGTYYVRIGAYQAFANLSLWAVY